MKGKVITAVISALVLCISHEAHADMLGNDWQQECEKADNFSLGVCLGEVLGEIEGVSSGFDSKTFPAPFCIPPNRVTNKQLQDILYKYIVTHPEQRHFHLSLLVLLALKEAFPRTSGDEVCTP